MQSVRNKSEFDLVFLLPSSQSAGILLRTHEDCFDIYNTYSPCAHICISGVVVFPHLFHTRLLNPEFSLLLAFTNATDNKLPLRDSSTITAPHQFQIAHVRRTMFVGHTYVMVGIHRCQKKHMPPHELVNISQGLLKVVSMIAAR